LLLAACHHFQVAADVVYEMAAVQPLVDSIHAAFTLGIAAACVVAYER
jgi:hypothetical protein